MVAALRDPAVRATWEQRATAAAGTALRDQLKAAAAQGEAVAAVALTDPRRRDLDWCSVPDWLLFPYVDVVRRFEDQSVRTCLHAPDPLRPQPVFAALWRPGLVVCGWCVHLMVLPRGSAADRTCDRCGVVASLVYPQVLSGPLSLLFGTCGPCATAEGWSVGGGDHG